MPRVYTLFVFSLAVLAQQSPVPIYRVTVEQRTIQAVNYGAGGAPTRIDYRGTVLLPAAKGEARIQNQGGAFEIDSKFEGLEAPARFGAHYLAYVLWAITPEGRPVNLGEIVPDASNKARIRVTTQLQAFGLLVTAEPYFAVTQPSNGVVLENQLRPDTVGKAVAVQARYELLPREPAATPAASGTVDVQPAYGEAAKVSLDRYQALLALYEAQNAVQIARAQGADQYAAGTLARAERLYAEAQRLEGKKADSKQVITAAREAAQTAEDARAITLRHAK